MAVHREVEPIKKFLLEEIKEELEDLISGGEEKEIYLHDIVHEVVDTEVGKMDRKEALDIIDNIGHEENIDEGLVDRTNIDRTILTTAYSCIEEELADDDFFQYLQRELNNETITAEKAKEIKGEVKKELENLPEE